MALWAVHTHTFDCFTNSPRPAITSPEKGCGKTTALDVLRELVARPLPTSNVTVAAVFRTIEMAVSIGIGTGPLIGVQKGPL
jgi:hypothetical protein